MQICKKIINMVGVLLLMLPVSANALLVSDLDLNSLSFEVDNLDSNTSATGTSNGIGFTLTVTSNTFFVPYSNITGSQQR